MDRKTATKCIKEQLASGAELSAQDLADICGISRQRVYQILRRERLYTTAPRKSTKGFKVVPPLKTNGLAMPMWSSMAGTVSELLVAADLAARGFYPFQPVVKNRSIYDLIAVRRWDGKVFTIEVKTGRRSDTGDLVYNKADPGHKQGKHRGIDFYAVVIKGEPVNYIPELPNAAEEK